MQLERLLEIPGTECVLAGPADAVVTTAFTSDLLSDVLAHAEEGAVLITIQAHLNAVAVASITGIRAILACSSRPVAADMLTAAREARVAVYRTRLNQFEASVAVARLLESR